jgi:hypothetical protein
MGIVFAAVAPIRLVRGTRWQDQVQLVDQNTGDPVSLADVESIDMWIRAYVNGPVLLALSLSDGLSIANPSSGLVDIDVSSDGTLALPENGNFRAKYVFDALITRTNDEREPAFAGKLTVLPAITRPWITP